ncbi:2OG-Fe(II) oxygenase [Aestuariivivens sediminis]|uniref:2OG-Fe(II) oxygenase n=1 Tax=Aestuariivivens sediminis TaxID=2913557 RepID=UPI001F561576|nr:2OG-Fe(II) oxygenase [Aestuariivivens sediminis]
MSLLFESIDFEENPLYESIISDLALRKYSIVDHFFNDEEVVLLRDALLKTYEDDKFKKAAIGNRLNENVVKSIRGDLIFWMDETNAHTNEKLFFNKVNDFIGYLNKTCFLGILQKEFHYAIYPKGTFYRKHLDTFQNDDRRKLSLVCYLNEDGWQPEYGGELVLYLKEADKIIYPTPGKVVIFESQVIEHEVKPVQVERLSITGWLKTR